MSWRNRVQHPCAFVVRPVIADRVAAVLASITRTADVKPAPSGQERGVW